LSPPLMSLEGSPQDDGAFAFVASVQEGGLAWTS
jgi:hypothetical protein